MVFAGGIALMGSIGPFDELYASCGTIMALLGGLVYLLIHADNIHRWIEEQRSKTLCQSHSSLIVRSLEKNAPVYTSPEREGTLRNVKSNYASLWNFCQWLFSAVRSAGGSFLIIHFYLFLYMLSYYVQGVTQ